MPASAVSRTAQFMALFRALESARSPERRLFHDPLARTLLPPVLRTVAHLAQLPVAGRLVPLIIDRRWPGARTSAVARTSAIDALVAAALRDGVDQVVLLGAGFDARAVRLAGLDRAHVIEVDRPAMVAVTRERVGRAHGSLPAHVTYAAADFERAPLAAVLADAGFDRSRPAFFVWEGVSHYLDAEGVDATLRTVAASARGTRLAMTYVHRGAIDGSKPFDGMRALRGTLERAGERWTFGLDPDELVDYLGERGLRLRRDIGSVEYRAEHLGATTRNLKGYVFYRLALAEVA